MEQSLIKDALRVGPKCFALVFKIKLKKDELSIRGIKFNEIRSLLNPIWTGRGICRFFINVSKTVKLISIKLCDF